MKSNDALVDVLPSRPSFPGGGRMRFLAAGVFLAVSVAAGSRVAAELVANAFHLTGSPISPILVAVVLGALARALVPGTRRLEPGYEFCLTWILRTGIVLLGLRLSLAATGAIGLRALPVVLVCIITALVAVSLLSRAVGLSPRLGTLIAAGTSICGCTAIVATAPVVKANKEEMSYAIGCITLFGLIAMFVNPLIAHTLFGSESLKAGIFLGTSIHETAQVAGAGMMYTRHDPAGGVLESATVTKLVRNLCMLFVIPVVSLAYSRMQPPTGPRPWSASVPGFVLGFVAVCALRTVGDLGDQPFGLLTRAAWEEGIDIATNASEWCLTIAMAAVGLSTDFASLRKLGLKPLLLGFVAAALVGLAASLTLKAL